MPEFKYDRSNPGPCCQKIDDMIQYARPIVERWPSFHKRSLGVDIMQECTRCCGWQQRPACGT